MFDLIAYLAIGLYGIISLLAVVYWFKLAIRQPSRLSGTQWRRADKPC